MSSYECENFIQTIADFVHFELGFFRFSNFADFILNLYSMQYIAADVFHSLVSDWGRLHRIWDSTIEVS